MTYVISDIHGYYDEYIKMLEEIKFCNDDVLYVLGDVLNRGVDGIKVLKDMITRENIFPIVGNHERMTLPALEELSWAEYHPIFDEEIIDRHTFMSTIGDQVTLRKFVHLPKIEKQELVAYIKGFPLYRRITVDQQKFLLVHAGLPDLSLPGVKIYHYADDDIEFYSADELTFGQHNFKRKYFEDTIIIVGHIPTFAICENMRGKIYRSNNNIAIDCGMGHGCRLGCLCLDTDEEFYI